MPKLKNDPIGEADLIEYLDTTSDFAFELHCLERMTKLGFECQHGGSYTDPVTSKTRQFDLRAEKSKGIFGSAEKSQGLFHLSCAIECKRLTESFPLLVLGVPGHPDESFHELILSYHRDMVEQSEPRMLAHDKRCEIVRIQFPPSPYAVDAFVGKSCAQVGRAQNDSSIVANDAEVFDKWSQALASASSLVATAAMEGEQHNDLVISLILPVLVVPDGTLWQAKYEANGTKIGDPVKTDRCSFFIGKDYSVGLSQNTSFTVSHLEFVTLSGLAALMEGIFVLSNGWFEVSTIFQNLQVNSPSLHSSISHSLRSGPMRR